MAASRCDLTSIHELGTIQSFAQWQAGQHQVCSRFCGIDQVRIGPVIGSYPSCCHLVGRAIVHLNCQTCEIGSFMYSSSVLCQTNGMRTGKATSGESSRWQETRKASKVVRKTTGMDLGSTACSSRRIALQCPLGPLAAHLPLYDALQGLINIRVHKPGLVHQGGHIAPGWLICMAAACHSPWIQGVCPTGMAWHECRRHMQLLNSGHAQARLLHNVAWPTQQCVQSFNEDNAVCRKHQHVVLHWVPNGMVE